MCGWSSGSVVYAVVVVSQHVFESEQLSPKHGFCLHLQACGKPRALDQVRLAEREQKHHKKTTIYSQSYENYMIVVRNQV